MAHPRITEAPIDSAQARAVAVRVPCDPRSVVKVTIGMPVRDSLRRRILQALEAEGLAHLIPAAASPRPAAISSVGEPIAG